MSEIKTKEGTIEFIDAEISRVEKEISDVKRLNPNWMGDAGDKALVTALTNQIIALINEKNQVTAKDQVAGHVFVATGRLKYGKFRGGCRQRLYRIAEENHAKVRTGILTDGIGYEDGITKHLSFKLVFEEKWQAEKFESAVEKVPSEYGRKRKLVDVSLAANIVVADIECEFQSIQREVCDLKLIRIKECDYVRTENDPEPSPEYDANSYTQSSTVSVNDETRFRLLEREDSRNFFRQKPEKCHIVRQADDKNGIKDHNNIVFMSRFLHQQLDVIDSTEGIPQFYFLYVTHADKPIQGLVDGKKTQLYETTFNIVFKDEEAKKELSGYFRNPTDVDQTTIQMTAYFPNPNDFRYYTSTKAEETIDRWKSYDGILDG